MQNALLIMENAEQRFQKARKIEQAYPALAEGFSATKEQIIREKCTLKLEKDSWNGEKELTEIKNANERELNARREKLSQAYTTMKSDYMITHRMLWMYAVLVTLTVIYVLPPESGQVFSWIGNALRTALEVWWKIWAVALTQVWEDFHSGYGEFLLLYVFSAWLVSR